MASRLARALPGPGPKGPALRGEPPGQEPCRFFELSAALLLTLAALNMNSASGETNLVSLHPSVVVIVSRRCVRNKFLSALWRLVRGALPYDLWPAACPECPQSPDGFLFGTQLLRARRALVSTWSAGPRPEVLCWQAIRPADINVRIAAVFRLQGRLGPCLIPPIGINLLIPNLADASPTVDTKSRSIGAGLLFGYFSGSSSVSSSAGRLGG